MLVSLRSFGNLLHWVRNIRMKLRRSSFFFLRVCTIYLGAGTGADEQLHGTVTMFSI